MLYTYVLCSESDGRFHTGTTYTLHTCPSNLLERDQLERH